MKKKNKMELLAFCFHSGFENVRISGSDLILEKTDDETGKTGVFVADLDEAFERSLGTADGFTDYILNECGERI